MRLPGIAALLVTLVSAGPARAGDKRAPTWPQGAALSAGADQLIHDRQPGIEEALNGGHVHLEWPPAADDRRVVAYRIFRDGRRVAQVAGDKTAWDRRERRAKGRWSVRAGDAAGNWSAPLAADVSSPMEMMFDTPAGAIYGVAPGSTLGEAFAAPDVRVRVGRRGGPAVFETSFEYHGERALLLQAKDLGVELRLVPDGTIWRLTVMRGDEELARIIANDPRASGSLGSCELDTDSEHNGGLWIELGIAGSAYSAARACAEITTPR